MGSKGEGLSLGRLRNARKLNTAVVAAGAVFVLGSAPALAKTTKKSTATAPTAAQVKKNVTKLYAEAKKEGTVDVDVLTSPSSYAAVVAGFEKKYPGISVQLVNVAGPSLAASLISQASTNNLQVDLAEARPEIMGEIQQRKLIATPNWVSVGLPATKILLDGQLVHTSDFVTGVIYNTKLLTKAEAPKSWKALLAPAWSNGKIIVDGVGTEGFESMLVNGRWNVSQYKSYVASLNAQKPLVIYQGAPETIAVAQGQAPIGLVPFPVASALIAAGDPIAVAPIQPVVSSPDGWFVLKGAHHSAAAELLATYFGSAAAEPLFAKGGFTDATPASLGGEAGAIGAAGITNFAQLDAPKSVSLFEKAAALNISGFGFNGGSS
jgi:ABC-type Fe3+ transport system substrate-binding protein